MHMKKNLSFLAILIVVAFMPALRGLHAQKSFEGTITWTMSIPATGDNEAHPMIIHIKGNKSNVDIDMGASGSVNTYSNLDTRKFYSCVDMSGRKMNYVADMDDPDLKRVTQKATDSLDLKPTGKKETIAGHPAEEFLLTGIKAQGVSLDMSIWAAADFPKEMQETFLHSLNKPGQDPKQNKAMKQLADRGLVPIRVVMRKDGEVAMSMEFVKYEQKSIDDSIVTPPADVKFSPMPKMPGMN